MGHLSLMITFLSCAATMQAVARTQAAARTTVRSRKVFSVIGPDCAKKSCGSLRFESDILLSPFLETQAVSGVVSVGDTPWRCAAFLPRMRGDRCVCSGVLYRTEELFRCELFMRRNRRRHAGKCDQRRSRSRPTFPSPMLWSRRRRRRRR